TVVFAGDGRLSGHLRSPELQPLESRIRARLPLQPQPTPELVGILRVLIEQAGNPGLMTDELMQTLAAHSHGNFRILMNIANELLLEAHARGLDRLDEKLYIEVTHGDHGGHGQLATDGRTRARRRP